MAKSSVNNGIRYRQLSGKNDYPGQFRLDTEKTNKAEIYEERPIEDEPASNYWKAFKDFLDKSGKFAQTWHLYLGIQDDPDLGELEHKKERLEEMGQSDPELEKELEGVKYHLHLMTVMHECMTLKELYKKAEKEWGEFKTSLHILIDRAKKAGVDPRIAPSYEKRFMACFVHEGYDGPCRREFYRKRYVRKYLEWIKENPTPPKVVNIREIEADFGQDEAFKKSFMKKRKKAKDRDHETRGQRMKNPRFKTKPNHDSAPS